MSYYRLDLDGSGKLEAYDVITKRPVIKEGDWLSDSIDRFENHDHCALRILGYAGKTIQYVINDLPSYLAEDCELTFWRHIAMTDQLPGMDMALPRWSNGIWKKEMLSSNDGTRVRKLPMNRIYSDPLPLP